MDDLNILDVATTVDMGWARRTRKQKTKFSKKQRDYLTQRFQDGIDNRSKFDPKVIAKRMRRDTDSSGKPVFEKSEYLTSKQISSFWSREARNRKLAHGKEGPATNQAIEEVDDNEYLDDPFFSPDAVLRDSINEADDIFQQ